MVAVKAAEIVAAAVRSVVAADSRTSGDGRHRLPVMVRTIHPAGMFVVTEVEAAAIRTAFEQCGELSAVAELRRLFPAITDTAQARACARTIAGWKPLPVPLRTVRQPSRQDQKGY